MWECFCCKQIGYMESTFKFFPKRHGECTQPICMICIPYVVDAIQQYEVKYQTKLEDFE
jgi:hypothetical protein